MSLSPIFRLLSGTLAAALVVLTFGAASQAAIIRSTGQSGGSNQCDGSGPITVVGVFAEIPGTTPQAYDAPAGQTAFNYLDPIQTPFGCGDIYHYQFYEGEELELGISSSQLLFPGDFWGHATPSYEFTVTSTSDTSMVWTFASPDTLHTFLAPSNLAAGEYDVALKLIITADAGFGLASTFHGPGNIWAPFWDEAQQGYVFDGDTGTYTVNGTSFVRLVILPVPEPETWLLILAGLAALTFYRRRRQKMLVTR